MALSETEVASDRLEALERELPKVRAEPPIVQPVHMRRSPRHLPRLLRLRALGVPYVVGKCDNVPMHALVEKHLRSGAYDVVYVGQLGMAAYLADARRFAPRAHVLLEEHNVEWEIFRRLAPTFAFALRQVTRWEANTLRRYERRILRAVDAVVAISDADARAIRLLAGVDAAVVPTYIEPSMKRVETTPLPALGYTGLLGWQPNAQGLDWFCASVWPLLRKKVPEVTLTIAGPGLNRKADGSLDVPPAWCLPGITTVGYVEDLEDVYRSSVAMVAPIIGGSGVRMKLLESMRAGMPTVTTTDGAAGLAVEDGREMFIANDPGRFAECVARVLSDAELRERFRSAGYAFLEAHHSLPVARAILERQLLRKQ